MEIPIFPLSFVLFPSGRMPLQIFEQRYLDLVKRCMKEDSGFGIVKIAEGSEVSRPGHRDLLLGQVGTYAQIVDWDSLPNGLLGITVQGTQSFVVNSTRIQPDHLMLADVDFIPDAEPVAAEELREHLLDILNALLQHPHARGLAVDFDGEDSAQIGNVLAQLLPVPEELKYELLCIDEPELRLERLDEILSELGGS